MGTPHDLIIVLVTPNGPGSGGGTQQALSRMIPIWVSEGRAITLLTYPVDERWRALPDGVELVALPAPDDRAMHSAAALARSILGIVRTALVVRSAVRARSGHLVLPFLPGASILTLIATFGLPNRIIPCERNDPTRQRFSLIVRVLRSALYRRAHAVTVNSTTAQRAFTAMLPARILTHVVLNPLPDWSLPADAEREDLIVSVGRLVPQKRHQDVIEAFAKIRGDHPTWRLEIVGDGPERIRLEKLTASLDVDGRVIVRGYAEDVRAVLERARVLILASTYEGTPNVVLEALAAQVTVVMSDAIPPLPLELEDHDAVRRFNPQEMSSLSNVMHELMRSVRPDHCERPHMNLEAYRASVVTSWAAALDAHRP